MPSRPVAAGTVTPVPGAAIATGPLPQAALADLRAQAARDLGPGQDLLRLVPAIAPRRRTAAVRASTSRSPRISMYGTFWPCARRILFCIRLSESSTSTNRRPAARSSAASSRAGSTWRSAIGMTTACTGATHSGNAPREVLHQDPDEPLQRAVDRAVDRHRPLRLPVLVDVGQVEPLGQHRRGRPGSSPSATRGRGRRRCRCRSWARRTCRPSASSRSRRRSGPAPRGSGARPAPTARGRRWPCPAWWRTRTAAGARTTRTPRAPRPAAPRSRRRAGPGRR